MATNHRAYAQTGRFEAWLWLTVPVAILMGIAAAVGAFVSDFYHRETPIYAAQGVAQDLITLAVALPALVICAVLAGRGSARARLVWLGVLIYVVYTYLMFAFSIHFNPLFLVYLGVLGCALYALMGGFATADPAGIKVRFGEGTPVKAVSIFLAVMAFLFYLVWLSEAVPASLAGNPPQTVVDNGLLTSPVHVLDMAVLLPAAGLAAFWLWQKRPLGYVLAGALLTKLALLGIAILAMAVSMTRQGFPVAPAMLILFGILTVGSLGLLVWYLRGLKAR